MDTLPPVDQDSVLPRGTAPAFLVTTTAAPRTSTTTASPTMMVPATMPPPSRVELSYVERMVIAVAIAIAIIMTGVLVALSRRRS